MTRISLLSCTLLLMLTLTSCSQTASQNARFSLQTAHPNAQKLMKEDFYWSAIDESGPFGSDAGSDAAYGFQKWRKTHPSTSPAIYLKQMLDEWNFPPIALDELDTSKIRRYISTPVHQDESAIARQVEAMRKELDSHPAKPGDGKKLTDEQLREIVLKTQNSMGSSFLGSIDEAIIGTAFAQFVMEGKVDPAIKNYAAKAIQREMLPIITSQFLLKPDQIKAHDITMNKLLEVVNKMPS